MQQRADVHYQRERQTVLAQDVGGGRRWTEKKVQSNGGGNLPKEGVDINAVR